MKKFLPIIVLLLIFVSCNKPAGELTGLGVRGTFHEANPYGMVFIKRGSFIMQYTDAGGVPRLTQDGTVSKRMLKSGVSIVANYGPDELIKANFTVTQFTLLTVFGPVPTSGSRLSAKQLNDIDRLEGGEFVIIKNIKAVGPDGKQRSLSPIQVQL